MTENDRRAEGDRRKGPRRVDDEPAVTNPVAVVIAAAQDYAALLAAQVEDAPLVEKAQLLERVNEIRRAVSAIRP